jgi:tetratricopeptide (TPR) repeat protein
LTVAEQRAAEVRARRGPRQPREQVEPPPWEREVWVDEGPLRSAAIAATERGATAAVERRPRGDLDPTVVAEVARDAGSSRAARYQERLLSAAEALDRGRFDDARRMVQPVLRDLPNISLAHEIAGLCWYGVGQWRKAAAELEMARTLSQGVRLHAVLADCYRAMRRFETVAQLWSELRAASPAPGLMAEGRIVAAGALADQGDLRGAIALFERQRDMPRTVREHHLRQWYALADLLDRSGDVVEARKFFSRVAGLDPDFVDVRERLAALGR